MHFNQFSYLAFSSSQLLNELEKLGLNLTPHLPSKKQFEHFIRWSFFTYSNTDYALSTISIDKDTDFSDFLSVRQRVDCRYFLYCSLSTLRFSYLVDFEDSDVFRKETGFPIVYGDLIENFYQYSILAPKREIS